MQYVQLRDREQIATYLNTNADVFVYSLGDLEDDFWPHTRWYGAVDHGEINAICLILTKYDPAIVLAISEPGNTALPGLVKSISNELPDYAKVHLGPTAPDALNRHFELTYLGVGWKMALRNQSKLASVDVSKVERLDTGDSCDLRDLYDVAYQGAEESVVFDPSMLELGPYFGVRENGRVVSAAGVHVYSPRFGVAAVANVATRPERRGRGLASSVTARLCSELITSVKHIGLNVAQSNGAAITAYQRIGFETVSSFHGSYARRRK